MAIRLQQIDELTRPDHFYLDEDDDCHYVLEYTARQRPPYDSTSNLIFNLKKSVDRRGRQEYKYKERAIREAGDLLRSVLNDEWLIKATLVPIPCSKAKDHPLYDDRMLRVMQRMTVGLKCDIRELVTQVSSLESFHGGCRLTPAQLAAYYQIDQQLCGPQPWEVTVFDDILTTGSHFKAMKAVILNLWPSVSVSGIFIARRQIPPGEL